MHLIYLYKVYSQEEDKTPTFSELFENELDVQCIHWKQKDNNHGRL